MLPGEYILRPEPIELNAAQPRVRLRVDNHGDRPIQVGSHTHFFEVNRHLRFDRAAAYGFRLDIPAGTALRFEPGEGREVDLVALAGRRRVYGMSGLVNGSLDENREAAIARARERGFRGDSRCRPPAAPTRISTARPPATACGSGTRRCSSRSRRISPRTAKRSCSAGGRSSAT